MAAFPVVSIIKPTNGDPKRKTGEQVASACPSDLSIMPRPNRSTNITLKRDTKQPTQMPNSIEYVRNKGYILKHGNTKLMIPRTPTESPHIQILTLGPMSPKYPKINLLARLAKPITEIRLADFWLGIPFVIAYSGR